MTERLRIAVLSRNFATTGGGAERYSIALVEELAARHEVHVFAQTIAHDFPGVTYHRIPMPLQRPRWINQLYFAWKTWRATWQGFDIVHSHENTWHGNVQTVHVLPVKHTLFAGRQGAALALRWLKVMTSPRLLAYLWLEKRRYAWALKKCVVCASSSLKTVLQVTYPDSAPMLEVVTPGVDTVPGLASATQRAQARAQLGLPMQAVLVLFVGNDFVKKGLPTLLQAMVQLPAQTQLAVVGHAESEPAMRRLAERLGLTERVHFLGSQRDMGTAYRAADMLAHPTLEDAYGMVVLEAMSHGLPVVVSEAPYSGIAQDLRDGENALLLKDPRNVAEIVTAVQRLQTEGGLASDMSGQALAFAQAHSWKRAAGSYEATYAGIAKRYAQRWLVLSHAFNMDGRAASQTITDKLPHLEAAGIELVVLSGVSGEQDRHYEHHQLWPAGAAGIRFELRHVLRKRLADPKVYRLVMMLLSIPLLPFMFIEKLLRPVESSWSWWLTAYLRGRSLARHRKFDLIYSTGGAFAAHVAGRALKKALGARWLAEVHDPLVMPGSVPKTGQERMQAEVERQICTDADVAIWFTEQALASARRRHPQLGERGKMMLPGIDAPFRVLPSYVPGAKMVIGHFGSLSATRNLTPIISALEALVSKRPELRSLLELQLAGGPLDAVSQAAITQSPVRDLVRHLGRIEADPVTGMSGREQILRRMRSADVLLLLHGTEPICAEYIPSKLYEYLWMQRPILATVHGNPQMVELLRGQGHFVVQDGDNFEEVLEKMMDRWRLQGLGNNRQVSPYTTRTAVQRLREFLA
ncbi:glycosyltransferase [Rhodoferax saidenbachensis]|uniref:Glycosyltransferase involved in cell wall biosynthesis n=1 Tax=Rhodoferax saidenbachensis TaxID=1484693 RepID=A0ABU1ZK10_9BURK|nr:glycosyltransferase [Rhodoferax saidenbachensis]MDR7305276.1 glycosyltransferase involved in cell wall biosynthesis [Rhodoferax saidenbachensis]